LGHGPILTAAPLSFAPLSFAPYPYSIGTNP